MNETMVNRAREGGVGTRSSGDGLHALTRAVGEEAGGGVSSEGRPLAASGDYAGIYDLNGNINEREGSCSVITSRPP